MEPHNLLRQNFYEADVGRFKSQALADRLARAYRRPVGYSVYPFREEDSRPDGGRYPGLPSYGNSLLMKAAPTTPPHGGRWRSACRATRAGGSSTRATTPTEGRCWSATSPIGTLGTNTPSSDQTCYLLPAPTVQRPDLLTAVSTAPPDVDCAAALDLTDQDPTINQMMASLALQVVRRMAAGACPFMGLYLDMEQGTVTPTYATPETVARVVRSDSEPAS